MPFWKRRRRKSSSSERKEPKLIPSGKSTRGKASRSGGKRKRPLIFSLMSWTLTLGLWGVIVMAATTGYVFLSLDKKGLFNIPEREPGLMLLASDGYVVAQRGSFFGDEARVAELPKYLPQAVIAIEDRRFYQHFGIDVVGLVRAAIANYQAGRIVQGGSTLTQQLAKNLFLKPERTMERKFQEAVLALWLESKYSKTEILQLYLNRVYFGAGAIGVEQAAKKFFGKSAKDVNLREAAVLAAVLKAPSNYNPLRNPDKAHQRAAEVIKDMLEAGFITRDEAERSNNRAQTIEAADYIPATQFIVDWVAELLPDLIGRLQESVVIETTLDRTMQDMAEKSISDRLNKEGKKQGASQGAAIVMDTTGAVKAMVGGKSYIKSQFNRVVKAKRQPGSAFKPFVYLTAVEQGMSPDSVEVDEPVQFGKWKPGNYSGRYRGSVTLRQALALSLNSVAAKLGVAAGPENIVTVAHRMGINSELKPLASISLGASEVTLLELTAAYAPFANGGKAVIPHIVKRITTRAGKVLYERRGSGLGTVVASYDIGAMNNMLQSVVTTGTGRRARIKDHEIAGKTGTSQDYRDAWFIGYSSHLIAGVWVGNDDNTPTKRVTGGSIPAMIWGDVMRPAHAELQPVKLPGNYQTGDEFSIGFDDGRSFVEILQGMFGERRIEGFDPEANPDFQNPVQRRSNAELRSRNNRRTKDLQLSR